MRYALRNKKKIINHFDAKSFARIIKSLDKEFKGAEIIEFHKAEPYTLISVNDVGHTCGLIIFHVISIRFDVLNLAFKEFIS